MSPYLKATLQALLVTFLWSTSWVLIKVGLADIPALTFAGLRYSLAFFLLLIWGWHRKEITKLSKISRKTFCQLILLGILFYTLTQGAQFMMLAYLPAVTVNLLLSFTSVVVALLGIVLLGERPTGWQWLGVLLSIGGAVIFFYPIDLAAGEIIGYLAALIGVLANAASSILGREINRNSEVDPLNVTIVSMGIGGFLLLTLGLGFQGMPALDGKSWLIIIWLALINTAFAFTLWNLTLKTLAAMESSIINNTMMIQIPILAVLFLGESLTLKALAGMIVAGIGVLIVQVKGRMSSSGKY
jgi:drug/metabolite transporter (DMT)-like permease